MKHAIGLVLVSVSCSSSGLQSGSDESASPKAATCTVSLAAPRDGATLDLPPAFSWTSDCDGARLEVSFLEDFGLPGTRYFGAFGPDVDAHRPPAGVWSAVVSHLDGEGYWRVVAADEGGEIATEPRHFLSSVDGTPPEPHTESCSVALTSPSDGHVDSATVPTFAWSGDCDAYALELSSSPDFLLPDTRRMGSFRTTSFTPQEAPWLGVVNDSSGEIYWRVLGGAMDGTHISGTGTLTLGDTDPGTTDPGTTDPGTDPGTTDPGTEPSTETPPVTSCADGEACYGFHTCGGGGEEGVCGCAPATCESDQCGFVADGCGGLLECSGCTGDEVCGGNGAPNVCATPSSPTVLTSCGSISASGHYQLGSDVSSSGDCFTISGKSNIYFDGNGHTITAGGYALKVSGHSVDITFRDAVVDGTGDGIQLAPSWTTSCSNTLERILIEDVHFKSGIIKNKDANPVCDIAVVGCTFDEGGVSLDNYGATHSGLLVAYNTLTPRSTGDTSCTPATTECYETPLYVDGWTEATLYGNVITGPVNLAVDTHMAFVGNTITSDYGTLDTYDIMRLWDIEEGLVAHNTVENLIAYDDVPSWQMLVTLKMYTNKNTTFFKNSFKGNPPDEATAAGDDATRIVYIRSASKDNLFHSNTFWADVEQGNGFLDHFSNSSYCDEDANYCYGESGCPGLPCYNRNNVFDSNTFQTRGDDYWLYAGGDGDVFKNNHFYGRLNAEACEDGTVEVYGNTFEEGTSALDEGSDCNVDEYDNTF